jgi:hypothetical protein
MLMVGEDGSGFPASPAAVSNRLPEEPADSIWKNRQFMAIYQL